MDNPIIISLVVSGIGMLILFLALAFIYGLMYLMTTFIKDRADEQEQGAGGRGQETGSKRQEARSRRLRAAAIGVALARAEQESVAVGLPEAEEPISSWRALHHQRQLTLNLPTRRVQ